MVVLAAFLAGAACVRAGEPPAAVGPGPAEREPAEAVELGEFWLGVQCYPVPRPLADQLGLTEQGGLVIEEVVPESPAEKAGLKRHDVVVEAGGKPIAHIPELIAAVNAAGEEELTLGIVRGGKRREVTATPARRPPEDRPRRWREPPRGEDLDRLWQWFGRVEPDADWQGPLRFHFFHPGAILPPGAELHPPLPDDMSVVIRKKGAQPTRITVERGDESWEVSENELGKLPDDVRPHVERMLGRFPVTGPEGVRILPRRPGDPAMPEAFEKPAPNPEAFEHHLEQQIDEMNRRLEEMRRSLDRWRGQGQPRAPRRPDRARPNPDAA
ncbi:MAG: S1C family serine protease [Thermoguttaceae bacterium]